MKQELALRHGDDNAARQAMEEFQKGLAQAHDQKLSDAIASLEASLKAVPTAAARETLALLYQKAGDTKRAIQLAEQAVSSARESGNAVKTAKAERLLSAVSASPSASAPKSCPSDAGLIGPKLDLPPGGDTFETATLLVPCVYKGVTDTENKQRRYYKLAVPRGKTLKVVMRTREGDAPRTEIRLHGPNGASLSGYYASGGSVLTKPMEFKADEPAVVYVGVNGSVRGSAFDFSVRQ